MATIVVNEDLGHPATVGKGGHVLFVMQWLHALASRGHDVVLVETLPDDLGADERSAATAYFAACVDQYWSRRQAALVAGSESLCGLGYAELAGIAGRAGLVIRLSAPYRRRLHPVLAAISPSVLIDTDPGYSHLWAVGDDPAAVFGEFDAYFTVGANVGTERSAIPTHGLEWQHVWNPVVPDWWAGDHAISTDSFTTIADWRGYGYLEFEGEILGPKSEEFEKFLDLPTVAGEPLVLVLNIDGDDPDAQRLAKHGWIVEESSRVRTPDGYRAFVRGSLGEFSCAKGGYVATRSGWFSDRSACYLAAGRPVILQATGFEDVLPTGEGLFAVTSVAEASEAMAAVRRDYRRHSQAARRVAAEYFDGGPIAAHVLAAVGIR